MFTTHENLLKEPFIQLYVDRKTKAEKEYQNEPAKLDLKEAADLIVDLSKDQPAVIIIDALDECDAAARPTFLRSPTDVLEKSKAAVKLLLTGRDNVGANLPDIRFRTDIEINGDHNSNDIAHYIRCEVESAIDNKMLLNGKVTKALKQEIIDKLGKQANGM